MPEAGAVPVAGAVPKARAFGAVPEAGAVPERETWRPSSAVTRSEAAPIPTRG